MIRASLSGILSIVLLSLSCSIGVNAFIVQRWNVEKVTNTSNTVIWVPDNFTSIQAAVNNATLGDTIIVRNGTYCENLVVNKTVSLLGQNFPIIDGSCSKSYYGKAAVTIRAPSVTLSGFIIQHVYMHYILRVDDHGIIVEEDFVNITGNIIQGNFIGIYISYMRQYCYVANNTFYGNGDNGIFCYGPYNYILGNVFRENGVGIAFDWPLNSFINNTLFGSYRSAVELGAYYITMRGNNLTQNRYGLIQWEHIIPNLIEDIDTSNTINGRPIYYWINQSDRKVPSDAGYVAIINSTNISAEGLDLRNNGQGILVAYSSNVTVRNCNMTDNWWGIYSWFNNNVSVYHNNIVGSYIPAESDAFNSWNSGYPSGGNYWGVNYTGTDFQSGVFQNETGSDGVGDTPFSIDDNNRDNYPLMAPIGTFDVGEWNSTSYSIDVISNSTVSHFQLNWSDRTLRFNVSGQEDSIGFCRVTVPNLIIQDLWQGNYTVLVDDQPPLETSNSTDAEDTYIFFTYQHSEHETIIIPELASKTLLLLPSIATIIAFYRLRKRLSKKHAEQAMRHKGTVSLVAIVRTAQQ